MSQANVDAVDADHAHRASQRRLWLELNEDIAALDPDDSTIAARRLRRRQQRLASEFVSENQGLVFQVVKKFLIASSGANHDEYINAGALGLWEAFLSWDPARGTFATFSRRHIEGAIKRAVHNAENTGVSYNDSASIGRIRRAESILLEQLGRRPTDEEVTSQVNDTEDDRPRVTLGKVRRVRMGRPTSLDRPVGEGDDTLGTLIESTGADVEPDAGLVVDVSELDLDGLSGLELFCLARRTGADGAPPARRSELVDMTGLGRERLRKAENTLRARLDLEMVDA